MKKTSKNIKEIKAIEADMATVLGSTTEPQTDNKDNVATTYPDVVVSFDGEQDIKEALIQCTKQLLVIEPWYKRVLKRVKGWFKK